MYISYIYVYSHTELNLRPSCQIWYTAQRTNPRPIVTSSAFDRRIHVLLAIKERSSREEALLARPVPSNFDDWLPFRMGRPKWFSKGISKTAAGGFGWVRLNLCSAVVQLFSSALINC